MNRLNRLLVLIVSLVSLPALAAPRPPNIVFIFADDLGYADVSFNGRREWSTSNLHRLSQEGTVFRRWYTAGVVCAPSRAALMTGRYGIHNGVTGNSSLDLPAEEVTIAEALKARGYATGLFGKWHHGAPRPGKESWTHPMDQGFDEFYGYTDAVKAWQKFPKEMYEGREVRPCDGYADTLFTNRALDFIQRHKSEPFFLYLPYIASHGVIEAPQEDIALFKGKFKEKDPDKPINATYAAMVYRLDAEIGRVLQQLDKLELSRNTIVIFTSDHGATFEKMEQGATNYFDSNRPFRGQKRTLWEGGVRVPAVVRWPGKIPAKQDSYGIIQNIDMFPTLLTIAGGDPAEFKNLDGRSVLDILRGEAKSLDRTLFWEWREGGDVQFAAMKSDLKMVITGGNQPELFNLSADPQERRTLHAEFPQELKAMKQGLDEWLATETPAAKERKQPRNGNNKE